MDRWVTGMACATPQMRIKGAAGQAASVKRATREAGPKNEVEAVSVRIVAWTRHPPPRAAKPTSPHRQRFKNLLASRDGQVRAGTSKRCDVGARPKRRTPAFDHEFIKARSPFRSGGQRDGQGTSRKASSSRRRVSSALAAASAAASARAASALASARRSVSAASRARRSFSSSAASEARYSSCSDGAAAAAA
jgi:hypothetical protein